MDRWSALLLTAAGLIGLVGLHSPARLAMAACCCCGATLSVAWRRRSPIAATAIAVLGACGFQYLTPRQDALPLAFALALVFYSLGRERAERRSYVVLVLLAVSATASLAIVAAVTVPPGSPAAVFAVALAAIIGPTIAGAVIGRRALLITRQEADLAKLEVEEELLAAAQTIAQRHQLARDLHDVVTHSVSVMAIQAGLARITAPSEPHVAADAVRTAIEAGSEAVSDLDRIVSLWNGSNATCDTAELDAEAGLAGLEHLLERVRQGGLHISSCRDGVGTQLPDEIDRVAYRVVQESLTNAIKHLISPARATVAVCHEPEGLRLSIVSTGTPVARTEAPADGGHGLVGMKERVDQVHGRLTAGPRPNGYAVHAWLPFTTDARPASSRRWSALMARLHRDEVVASAWVVALVAEALLSPARKGPLAINLVIVAAMGSAFAMRRRSPLTFLILVNALALPLSNGLTSISTPTLCSTYVFAVPTYSVAAWAVRRSAITGLVIALLVPVLVGPPLHIAIGQIAGNVVLAACVWAVGRVAAAQRTLANDVAATSERLAQQRQRRLRIALATQREELARSLHEQVTWRVAAMVDQAHVVEKGLSYYPSGMVSPLEEIEGQGREALVELRRILGILRAPSEPPDLVPVPDVDQLRELIDGSRADGFVVSAHQRALRA